MPMSESMTEQTFLWDAWLTHGFGTGKKLLTAPLILYGNMAASVDAVMRLTDGLPNVWNFRQRKHTSGCSTSTDASKLSRYAVTG